MASSRARRAPISYTAPTGPPPARAIPTRGAPAAPLRRPGGVTGPLVRHRRLMRLRLGPVYAGALHRARQLLDPPREGVNLAARRHAEAIQGGRDRVVDRLRHPVAHPTGDPVE